MNKQIKFSYKGKDYTLEYNRETVAVIERQGFSINELSTKPMSMLPLAFEGLFLKNHKFEKKTIIDEIYDNFKDKDKLIQTIAEMLSETYSELSGGEEGKEQGNIDWEVC